MNKNILLLALLGLCGLNKLNAAEQPLRSGHHDDFVEFVETMDDGAAKDKALKYFQEKGGHETYREGLREVVRALGWKELADEHLKYELGGLTVGATYSIYALKQLECVKYGIVDLDHLDSNDRRPLDFGGCLQMLIQNGGGEDVFKRTKIYKDNYLAKEGAADLARQHQHERDKERYNLSLNYWKNLLSDREIVKQLIMLILAVFLTLFGGKILFKWASSAIENAYMRKPELIIDTNIKFRGGPKKHKLKDRSTALVINKELRPKIAKLAARIRLAQTNKQVGIPNLIFEGKPGVGKTATAMEIIRQSGAQYAKIDGSRLLQWETPEAIEQANKLIKALNGQKKATYLIIDEADVLFGKRVDDKRVAKILTPFLAQFAKTSGRVGLILLTNLYDELDSAAINRTSPQYIWKFHGPTAGEATDIAVNYLLSEAKRLKLDCNIMFNSRNVRETIYDAMEALEGVIVGRTIEAVAQQAAIDALNAGSPLTLSIFMKTLTEIN